MPCDKIACNVNNNYNNKLFYSTNLYHKGILKFKRAGKIWLYEPNAEINIMYTKQSPSLLPF